MRHVFDPDVLTLADPLADPRRVLEIQAKVKELIEAGRHRADALEQEIAVAGAWALPGLVNATLVWSNLLEGNLPAQDRIEGLMRDVCVSNEAAADLLLRAGVLECPFPLPRTMARRVLEAIPGWRPNRHQANRIRASRTRFQKFKDDTGEADALALLLRAREPGDFEGTVAQCKAWLRSAPQSAGKLLATLVQAEPEKGPETVIDVLGTAPVQELRRNPEYAKLWADPLSDAGFLPTWLENGILARISAAIIHGRSSNKTIERLWRLSLRDFAEPAGLADLQAIEGIGSTVRQTGSEVMCRYWFMSLAGAAGQQLPKVVTYLRQQLNTGGNWAMQAGVQLFFLKSRGNAQSAQILNELHTRNPGLYQEAMDTYETIRGSTPVRDEELPARRGPITPREVA